MEMSDISLLCISYGIWGIFLVEATSLILTFIGVYFGDDDDDDHKF